MEDVSAHELWAALFPTLWSERCLFEILHLLIMVCVFQFGKTLSYCFSPWKKQALNLTTGLPFQLSCCLRQHWYIFLHQSRGGIMTETSLRRSPETTTRYALWCVRGDQFCQHVGRRQKPIASYASSDTLAKISQGTEFKSWDAMLQWYKTLVRPQLEHYVQFRSYCYKKDAL